MTTPIETALADLCAKHGLTIITIGMNLKQAEGSRFDCSAHWDGYSRRGISCVSGFGSTAAQALKEALVAAASDRTQPEPSVPALTLDEAA
jgi:hypothetical protein